MQITETLRNEPYNFTADTEYYTKGYRAIVGVPGRVLQAKELTALSMYPIYALNDCASEIFSEGVIQGFDISNDTKISNGSIFGMTTDAEEDLSIFQVYDIDEDSGVEQLIFVDLSELETAEETTETPSADDSDDIDLISKENKEYTVKIYKDTGEEGWLKNII